MLPINTSKNNGCTPVSSNCVIWQGPDIECINLCKGDTVSDVTAKLAQYLCDILCQLDIKNYELTCFNPICPDPKNFHDLVQFLIDRICQIQGCVFKDCAPGCDCLTCKDTGGTGTGCPDECIVNIAPCFQYTDPKGDIVTTLPLKDYTQSIGVLLCQILSQFNNSNGIISDMGARVGEIALRVGVLEDASQCTIEIPSSCLLGTCPPSGGWDIILFVQTLETAFCNLQAATGTPTQLYQAIGKQCAGLDTAPSLADPNTTMGTIPGWVTQVNYRTVADSLNNMWLTICDIRASILNLQQSIVTGCDAVTINFSTQLSGTTLNLFFSGAAPSNFTDCFPNGNLVTITDGYGGAYSTFVPVIPNLNGSATINLAGTPIVTTTNLTVTINGCWTDGDGCQCQRILVKTIINTIPCPILTLTPQEVSIDYSFNNGATGPVTYLLSLYTASNAFVTSFTHTNPPMGAVVGSFAATSGTSYYVVMTVTINGVPTECPPYYVSTPCSICASPIDVTATPS